MSRNPRRIVYHGEVWVERSPRVFRSPCGTQLSEADLREMKDNETRECARARRGGEK